MEFIDTIAFLFLTAVLLVLFAIWHPWAAFALVAFYLFTASLK